MQNKEFVITDGTKFIRRTLDDKYVQVKDVSLAVIFPTQKAAKNIMFNSIPRSWSKTYYVAEIDGDKLIQCNIPRNEKPKPKRCGTCVPYDSGFANMELCKQLSGLPTLFEDAVKRGRDISQKLSDVEAMLIDLDHLLEFTSINAYTGYKIADVRQTVLKKRRELKDEQIVVEAINSNRAALAQLNKIADVIKQNEHRSYSPRILSKAFEEGICSINKEEILCE